MAQELEQAVADPRIDCQLIPGAGGIFEVRSPQGLLFSKAQEGRFPDPGEIAALVRKAG